MSEWGVIFLEFDYIIHGTSVKHEDVYLKGYVSVGELRAGLARYFVFYNGERPHQSLGNLTPYVVYQGDVGGGAMIVDKYPAPEDESSVPLRSTDDSSSGKPRRTEIIKTPSGQYCSDEMKVQCTA